MNYSQIFNKTPHVYRDQSPPYLSSHTCKIHFAAYPDSLTPVLRNRLPCHQRALPPGPPNTFLSVSVMFKSLLPLFFLSGRKLWHTSWQDRLSNMQNGQGLHDQKELVMVFLVIFPKFNVCSKQSRFIPWQRWNIQHIGPCFTGTVTGGRGFIKKSVTGTARDTHF